uniref:Uncharacterized protein n=1 Tax=Meleagris gallopavo TaxID=9103 RepID=G1MYR2_MELGA
MISPPERARPRRAGESYEEKCERRQETREALRRRGHAHSARRPGRSDEQPQSPRQREFLRRRNLGSTAGELSPPILLQVMLHPHHVGALIADPMGTAVLSAHLTILPPPKAQRWTQLQPSAPCFTDSDMTAVEQEHPYIITIIRPRAASPQEALHRELLLKQKMVILQELLATLLHASEKSWQGQLNEDKLKCKLRALENQLQACTQSYSKECVKKILIEMEDQKQTYEQKAKEALQKMLEDKLQAEQQLQNSQVGTTFDTWLCINLIQPPYFREGQQPVYHLQRFLLVLCRSLRPLHEWLWPVSQPSQVELLPLVQQLRAVLELPDSSSCCLPKMGHCVGRSWLTSHVPKAGGGDVPSGVIRV